MSDDLSPAALAALIDHTLLRPDATGPEIVQACRQARRYGFATVCVAPVWVELAAREIEGAVTRVGTVAGFPHGNTYARAKALEARLALAAGAREVDMVLAIGALKSGDREAVLRDIAAVVAEAKPYDGVVKVIIEAALLSEPQKMLACELAEAAGADFVKTCTGYGPGGATVADVALMRRVVGGRLGVKAAGGIRTLAAARAMLRAGASRLGCSASVAIVDELYAAMGRPPPG